MLRPASYVGEPSTQRTRSLRDERWDALFAEYVAFLGTNGRHPRRTHTCPIENSLAEWAREQRRIHRGHRGSHLRLDRRSRLESLPGWTWEPRRGPKPQSDRWESVRREVVAFFEAHGRYPRTASADINERRLAAWVKNQAERLRARTDDVAAMRIAALNSTPGWSQR